MNDVKNGSGDLQYAHLNWVSPLWLVNSKQPTSFDFLGNKNLNWNKLFSMHPMFIFMYIIFPVQILTI